MRTGELRLEEVPVPALRPGGLLIKVEHSLISSGTERSVIELGKKSLLGKARERPDLVRKVLGKMRQEGLRSTYRKAMTKLQTPIPLGYSCAGTVVEVGAGVTGFQPGDRVACAGQGYASHAEYVFVPRNLCVKVPDGVGLDAAAFVTLGAIAMQGIRVAEVRLGERVAVIGLGLLGQLTVQILKAAGCKVAGVDLDSAKVALAGTLGCDLPLHRGAEGMVGRLLDWAGGHGVDHVIITAATGSNDPIELASELCRDKGIVTVVGAVRMDVPRKPFYDKELQLRLSRSYGPGRYDPSYEEKGIDYPFGYVRWTEQRNMESFLELVASGRVDVSCLITHRFDVEQATEAYGLITGEGGGKALGVLLAYSPRFEMARKLEMNSVPRSTRGKVRVGLIGAGDFARAILVPAVQACPQAEIRAVAAATGLSATQIARQVGAAYCATDPKEILADPEIDSVVIATRHNLHAELAVRAMEAGKSVFVEKPLALNHEELARVVDTARRTGQPLMVGFNRRFAPLIRQAKDILAGRGPFLMHYRVNAGTLPPTHWTQDPEEGGGRIVGEVCHFIDVMQFLTQGTPNEVHAVAARPAGSQVNDNVAITLRFADGSAGQIVYSSTGSPLLPKERLEVFAGGRTVVIDDFRSGVAYLEKSQQKLGGGAQDKGHRAEISAWFGALSRGKASPIPLEELQAVTLSTLAIEHSIRSGKADLLGGNWDALGGCLGR